MFKRKNVILKGLLSDYKEFLNKEVNVCGWIDTFRCQKKNGIAFISLNDGSCITSLQVIINPESEDELNSFDNIYQRATKGVCINAFGKVIESPANGQDIELVCKSLKIYGDVDGSIYPIPKNKLKLEHIRQFPHLRIRTKTLAAISRIRNACSIATHEFFQSHEFKYVHTPILTGNDCEGAGETFNISNTLGDNKELFFGRPTNLTVSGQLHGETYACGLSNIYTFGPTFRAEDSHTTRHLAEFWMIEPEMCFIDFKDLIDICEDYLKHCINYCLQNNKEELDFFNKNYDSSLIDNLISIVNKPFSRMKYSEVIHYINKDISEGRAIIRDPNLENKKFKKIAKGKHIFEGPINTENGLLPSNYDLDSEHEKYMTSKLNGVLVITDFPKDIKSFYMKENNDNFSVQAMDILVPNIGELIGGSMREDNFEILDKKMKDKGIEIPWYLDLRKFGSAPHGGFGLGFERLIMLITGIYNIRDIIPYPRYPKHCYM
jgi:asparaginyl-tRNA synthetase